MRSHRVSERPRVAVASTAGVAACELWWARDHCERLWYKEIHTSPPSTAHPCAVSACAASLPLLRADTLYLRGWAVSVIADKEITTCQLTI